MFDGEKVIRDISWGQCSLSGYSRPDGFREQSESDVTRRKNEVNPKSKIIIDHFQPTVICKMTIKGGLITSVRSTHLITKPSITILGFDHVFVLN